MRVVRQHETYTLATFNITLPLAFAITHLRTINKTAVRDVITYTCKPADVTCL